MGNNKGKRVWQHVALPVFKRDAISGAPLFHVFLKDANRLLHKNTDRQYYVVSLNADKFQSINDLFGYEEGNEVLSFIAATIQKELCRGETFARRTADSFAVLMQAQSRTELCLRLERIAALFNAFGRHYQLSLSMGIYEVDELALSVQAMLDRADLPRKLVHGRYGTSHAFYREELRSKKLREKELENRMVFALQNKEFAVYYQPKYSAEKAALSGAEALVRWMQADGSLIYPGDFVPLFETNGFIVELDRYIFQQVCRQIRRWLDEGLEVVPVSVNLSRLHMYRPAFVEEYEKMVQKYRIPHNLVQLEVTETALLANESSITGIVDRLHTYGFQILMDDFGTGYSTLNMLKDVPVDVLKLDKSFMDDVSTNLRGQQIVKSVIRLAQTLGMTVTAEGVETEEQYGFLKTIHCDEIQGYYFAKPMPAEDFRMRILVE